MTEKLYITLLQLVYHQKKIPEGPYISPEKIRIVCGQLFKINSFTELFTRIYDQEKILCI